MYAWGNGDHGKLGLGDAAKVTSPRLVEALRGLKVLTVASYNEHSAVLVDAPGDALAGGGRGSGGLASAFAADMGHLLDSALYADVWFLVEGRRVPAHRAILTARCDHFRALFGSGMRDGGGGGGGAAGGGGGGTASGGGGGGAEVVLEGVGLRAFGLLLRFLYTNAVDVGPTDAVELYRCATCRARDRSPDAVGVGCWGRLLGSAVGVGCWGRLLGSAVGVGCWGRLLGSAVGVGCCGRRPASLCACCSLLLWVSPRRGLLGVRCRRLPLLHSCFPQSSSSSRSSVCRVYAVAAGCFCLLPAAVLCYLL